MLTQCEFSELQVASRHATVTPVPHRDICDTGDDALPDPNAPKEKEKEPETLEEALAVAAKKLRGVDSDHRKLTIAELQQAPSSTRT